MINVSRDEKQKVECGGHSGPGPGAMGGLDLTLLMGTGYVSPDRARTQASKRKQGKSRAAWHQGCHLEVPQPVYGGRAEEG